MKSCLFFFFASLTEIIVMLSELNKLLYKPEGERDGKSHVPQPRPLLWSGWKKAKRSGHLVQFENNKHLLFSFQFQCPEATVNMFSMCKSFHSSKARGE